MELTGVSLGTLSRSALSVSDDGSVAAYSFVPTDKGDTDGFVGVWRAAGGATELQRNHYGYEATMSPDGTHLTYLNWEQGALGQVQLANNATTTIAPNGVYSFATSGDGSRLVFAREDTAVHQGLYRWDRGATSATELVSLDDYIGQLEMSRDGSTWLAATEASTILPNDTNGQLDTIVWRL